MTPFYENITNDLRVFYTEGLHFPAHLHSQMELLYVERGIIEVTIFNETRILSKGDFAVIFPNTIHSYDAKEEEEPSRSIISICSLELTGDFFKKLTSYCPTTPFITKEQLHPNVSSAMLELEKEGREGDNRNACRALVLLILSRVLPMVELAKNRDIENYDLTYHIVSYVAEHFQESMNLTELAKHLNVSKYYLSRTFSAKLNTSFNRYINYIRANYAQTLIQSTNYTLTRISVDSGFESQRTFNRAFKEIFGLAPSEYRQRASTTV
ncbi:MAG: DNA-binding protein AraC-type [Herbinix sp.]|jgi:AraC-like DNA-binding protein|nr:DNA-binding protein AraC-type [Herbinix sp.]